MNVIPCWSAIFNVSIRERRLWVRFYFPNSTQHTLFVFFGWFVWWEVSFRTVSLLYGVPSGICWKQDATLLCSSQLAFSPGFSLDSQWCNLTVALTQLLLESIQGDQIYIRSIAVHFFSKHMLTSFLANEILLPKYVKWSTNLRGLPFRVEHRLDYDTWTVFYLISRREQWLLPCNRCFVGYRFLDLFKTALVWFVCSKQHLCGSFVQNSTCVVRFVQNTTCVVRLVWFGLVRLVWFGLVLCYTTAQL